MSLDTLLKIGDVFRTSESGLTHHRYVKQPPQRDLKNLKAVGNSIRYFVVPAQADGSFDFSQHRVLEDEDAIRHLFYLNFKTGEADTYKKFIFGDVFRLLDEKTKKDSGGNFVIGDAAKNGLYALNSFRRGELEMPSLQSPVITNFRDSFVKHWEQIEKLMMQNPQMFLHFDFDGKSWWQLEEPMRVLNEKLLADIVSQREDGSYVLQKYLYKALAMDSGRIPGLSTQQAYKCRTFRSVDEVMNLVYVLDFSTKPVIRKGDVKIIVLPRGENLSAQVIENFFERKTLGNEEVEKDEDNLDDKNQPQAVVAKPADEQSPDDDGPDEAFAPVVQDVPPAIVAFDFIFSKAGGVSSPDVDMIEVPGLQRSLLNELSKRVRQIKVRVLDERKQALSFAKKLLPLSITQSFLNLLGDATTAKKKYQSHLFKTLPQIYTGTYYNDPVLLPALIEKTEFNIRNDKQPSYVFLRWDFIFLLRIQNHEGDRMKELTASTSYRVGMALGKLARQFSGKNSPIKSFEKNYVGLLSRRISNLPDVMQMGNDINQKIIMHRDDIYFSPRDAQEFSEAIKVLQASGARYDKNECAFGFFESYYASRAKTENTDTNAEPEAEAQPTAV